MKKHKINQFYEKKYDAKSEEFWKSVELPNKANETKLSSDHNTAELAWNQESIGEQFICSDAQTTHEVRHHVDNQELAGIIEILKEDHTDAVLRLTLIRRGAEDLGSKT